MLAPRDALCRLTCSFCNNYLSIFPVHYEDEQKTYTCGRCPLITSLHQARQVAYEELAKFMRFPCMYEENGCLENSLPCDLIKHENSCKHRPYFCPLLPLGDCPWQGRHDELYEHFLDSHRDYTFDNNEALEVDLINNYERHFIFLYENQTFLLYLKCNTVQDSFYCSIKSPYSTEDKQAYNYMVTLLNDHGDSYQLEAQPVQANTNNVVDRAKATCVDISNIKLKLHNPNIVLLRFKLLKPEKPQASSTGLSKFDEDILRNIECPVCMEYMISPILQCNTGHSICEKCMLSRKECPTCRGTIGNTRNFSLEEFTRFIKYPCKYRDFGCNFTGNSSEIRGHEVACKLGPFNCPLDGCAWKNKLSNLLEHVKQEHQDNFLDLDVVDFFVDPGENEDMTYIINNYGDFFKLYFCYEDHIFYWAMQTMGAVDTNSRYMFELDIRSNDDSQRFFARKNCSSLTTNTLALDEEQSYIEFSENLLKDVIVDDILHYSIRIFKEKVEQIL